MKVISEIPKQTMSKMIPQNIYFEIKRISMFANIRHDKEEDKSAEKYERHNIIKIYDM